MSIRPELSVILSKSNSNNNNKGNKTPAKVINMTEREVNDNVNKTATMVGVGYGLYLTAKWGAALFFAPETAGSSLILAGSTP